MITCLCGGVGGAKLALGLARVLPPGELTVVVNTADDLTWRGLHVSPDVDTVIYTLAGSVDPTAGWGLRGDTSAVLDALARFGEPDWFHIGDRDLATHLARTAWLNAGLRPTEVVGRLAAAWGIAAQVLPMSDSPVRTIVKTPAGELDFQEYFVHQKADVPVSDITFAGVESATPTPEVSRALDVAEAILIAPSNPFLSIGPLLSLHGFRDRLRLTPAPVVAVTPLVAGQAIKGPTARLFAGFGLPASALSVAQLYADFLDGFVLDERDAGLAPAIEDLGMPVFICDTIMRSLEDRERLAGETLAFARTIRKRSP